MMTITKRDSKGRILPGGKVLSSEEAKDLVKQKVRAGTSRDQLLKEAGYDDPEEAPESKRLMAQEAAKGHIPAIKGFLGKEEAKDVSVVVQPGERCPTCHQYVLADMQITDDEMDSVINELDL